MQNHTVKNDFIENEILTVKDCSLVIYGQNLKQAEQDILCICTVKY